jgi:hypothetical protein
LFKTKISCIGTVAEDNAILISGILWFVLCTGVITEIEGKPTMAYTVTLMLLSDEEWIQISLSLEYVHANLVSNGRRTIP